MLLTTQLKGKTFGSRRGVTQWRVTVTHEAHAQRVFHVALGRTLRIGSNPSNEIALDDPWVSRGHAALTAHAEGLQVRDLGSTNGCWWNGAKLRDGLVSSGVLRIADFQLTVAPSKTQAHQDLSAHANFGGLVGQSESMRALFKELSTVATSPSTILIQGESGTGKELVARAIHEASPRAKEPYVVFDCAALAPSLIETALFGHEKGAFTGATSRKIGLFEEANGGTLFLDELGELPLELQPKLLRALESREIRRIGGSAAVPLDVRFIAATHRDLTLEVNRGQFREDLYYRLAVIRVRIPPLRVRRDDLRLLVEHLMLQATGGDEGKVIAVLDAMTQSQWQFLKDHPWHGNVRELRNVVERALAMSSELAAPAEKPEAERYTLEVPYLSQKQSLLERFESQYLTGVVELENGNIARAAERAGLDRSYFKRLLKKYKAGAQPSKD